MGGTEGEIDCRRVEQSCGTLARWGNTGPGRAVLCSLKPLTDTGDWRDIKSKARRIAKGGVVFEARCRKQWQYWILPVPS